MRTTGLQLPTSAEEFGNVQCPVPSGGVDSGAPGDARQDRSYLGEIAFGDVGHGEDQFAQFKRCRGAFSGPTLRRSSMSQARPPGRSSSVGSAVAIPSPPEPTRRLRRARTDT